MRAMSVARGMNVEVVRKMSKLIKLQLRKSYKANTIITIIIIISAFAESFGRRCPLTSPLQTRSIKTYFIFERQL